MRSELSSFADDARTLFDFAKIRVGLAWQPAHGGVIEGDMNEPVCT